MATSKAEKFIMSTDFATIKNDSDVNTTTISLAGSRVISAGSVYSQTSDITLGTVNAPMTFYIKHSQNDKYLVSSPLQYVANGLVSGVSQQYTATVFVYRLNSTTIRMQLSVYNFYSNTLTTESTARTITLYVKTYLTPFG